MTVPPNETGLVREQKGDPMGNKDRRDDTELSYDELAAKYACGVDNDLEYDGPGIGVLFGGPLIGLLVGGPMNEGGSATGVAFAAGVVACLMVWILGFSAISRAAHREDRKALTQGLRTIAHFTNRESAMEMLREAVEINRATTSRWERFSIAGVAREWNQMAYKLDADQMRKLAALSTDTGDWGLVARIREGWVKADHPWDVVDCLRHAVDRILEEGRQDVQPLEVYRMVEQRNRELIAAA